MTRRLALLTLMLLACKTGKIGGDDTGDGGSTDGGTTDGGTTDGGTGDGGTTDGGTADGGTPLPDTFLFQVEGELDGRVLAFAELTEVDGDLPGFGQALDAFPLTGAEVGYSPGDLPGDAHLWQLNPKGWPGWEVALYMPVVFEDADGDAVLDEGEVLTAANEVWIGWFEAPLPSEVVSLGFVEGWNAMVLAPEEFPELSDPQDIAVPQLLAPADPVTLGGSYEGSEPADEVRIALVAGSEAFAGEPVASRLDDQPVAAAWVLTLEGAPPADHYADLDGSGTLVAAEIPLAYRDVDGDEQLDLEGDLPLYGACLDGDVAVAIWVAPLTDLSMAWATTWSGAGTGWQVVVDPDGDGRVLAGDELTSLVVDDACQLGD